MNKGKVLHISIIVSLMHRTDRVKARLDECCVTKCMAYVHRVVVAIDALYGQMLLKAVGNIYLKTSHHNGRIDLCDGIHLHAGTANGHGFCDVRGLERTGRQGDDIAVLGCGMCLLQGSCTIEGGDFSFMAQGSQYGTLCITHGCYCQQGQRKE